MCYPIFSKGFCLSHLFVNCIDLTNRSKTLKIQGVIYDFDKLPGVYLEYFSSANNNAGSIIMQIIPCPYLLHTMELFRSARSTVAVTPCIIYFLFFYGLVLYGFYKYLHTFIYIYLYLIHYWIDDFNAHLF